ncbi:response regulator [Aquabacterium sp.]|uniref:response regulator n=1 Tax=Aquabacterium sp. TaxID=1872578 RepID=UPI0025BF645B|nr:response regulator [Aquabacterium sp.]
MKTILLIDDSAIMLKSMEITLSMNGYATATASDGIKAIELINQGLKPDLVLTDINMPNMDGIAFIREARKLLKFTPIIALTNDARVVKRQEAKKEGATGWMIKPVGGQELLKIVQQVMPRTA